MTAQTYFKDMQTFIQNCSADKRLTPNTQLVYRTLCDLANEAYWAANFIATDDRLMNITHIKSRDTITTAKNKLIALGYLTCKGKPNKYTIYRPTERKPTKNRSIAAPPDPQVHTNIQPNNTLQERKKRKKEGTPRDLHHSNANSTNPSSNTPTPTVEELRRQAAELF